MRGGCKLTRKQRYAKVMKALFSMSWMWKAATPLRPPITSNSWGTILGTCLSRVLNTGLDQNFLNSEKPIIWMMERKLRDYQEQPLLYKGGNWGSKRKELAQGHTDRRYQVQNHHSALLGQSQVSSTMCYTCQVNIAVSPWLVSCWHPPNPYRPYFLKITGVPDWQLTFLFTALRKWGSDKLTPM